MADETEALAMAELRAMQAEMSGRFDVISRYLDGLKLELSELVLGARAFRTDLKILLGSLRARRERA